MTFLFSCPGGILAGRNILILESRKVLQHPTNKLSRIPQRPKVIKVKRKKIITHQFHRIRFCHQLKPGVKANMQSLGAKDPVAKRVESHNPHLGVAVGHGDIHPLFHFLGGFVGKSQS